MKTSYLFTLSAWLFRMIHVSNFRTKTGHLVSVLKVLVLPLHEFVVLKITVRSHGTHTSHV